MENLKFKVDYRNEEVEGRNVHKEEKKAVNYDDDEKECIRRFFKMADTLDDLFGDILKRKSQRHCNVDRQRTAFMELTETVEKLVTDLKINIKLQEDTFARYKAENSELKREVDKLKDQIMRSDSYVCELRENLENCKQEKKKLLSMLQNSDTGCDSLDLTSWVTVASNEKNDLNSKQKSEIGNKSDETGKLESGKEAERKVDEETKELQLTIEMMDNWYNFKWTDVYLSLLQEKLLNHSTITDIMFRTLWEACRFSIDTKSMQVKKISLNFNFPYSSELAEHNVAEIELPQDIVQSLKEFLAKVEPKDMNRTFREKFQKELSAENAEFLNKNPKFISYISDCLQLCRQLMIKSKCVQLKSHKIGSPVNKECFILHSGSESGVVERVIFPALVISKNNKVVTLRKGLVSTKLIEAE